MENNSEKSISVLGLLSTIFGSLSIVPFLGIFSVVGLILGIISLIKKGGTLAIIGTALSVVGVSTSPSLWALVICSFNSETCTQTIKNNFGNKEEKLNKNNLN